MQGWRTGKAERHEKMKKANSRSPLLGLAEWTGLEPATPGVTGRYSNQLNYHSVHLYLVGAERFELPTFAL